MKAQTSVDSYIQALYINIQDNIMNP